MVRFSRYNATLLEHLSGGAPISLIAVLASHRIPQDAPRSIDRFHRLSPPPKLDAEFVAHLCPPRRGGFRVSGVPSGKTSEDPL